MPRGWRQHLAPASIGPQPVHADVRPAVGRGIIQHLVSDNRAVLRNWIEMTSGVSQHAGTGQLTRPDTAPRKAFFRLTSGLLFRAVAALLAVVLIVSSLLFISIDRLVSSQFSALHEARTAMRADQLKSQIEADQRRLLSLLKLVVNDADLRHSVHYHIALKGERWPLEADVRRIARALDIDMLGIWDAQDRLVTANTDGLDEVLGRGLKSQAAQAQLLWFNDKLWSAASMPLLVDDQVSGWIRVAESSPVTDTPPAEATLVVRDTADASANLIALPVYTEDGSVRSLELQVSDSVEEAISHAKRLIGAALLVVTFVLALGVSVYLRRLIMAMRELTDAAVMLPSRLKTGTLKPLEKRGNGELADLRRAFDKMMVSLVQLRELETELRDKEKLSAVGRVALRVAHDLNNPLTVIKNTARLLLDEHLGNAQSRQDLQMIVRHCARCTATIDNLLRFGKPLRLRIEPVNLQQLLESFSQGLRHSRPEAELRMHAPAQPLIVAGDPHQLEQMLDSLIDNAFDANGAAPVDVELGSRDEQSVYIRITDNGPGFPAEDLGQIFELFYTTKDMGTGLGLPNARAIAWSHKGDILVTAPEQGQVTVILPRE